MSLCDVYGTLGPYRAARSTEWFKPRGVLAGRGKETPRRRTASPEMQTRHPRAQRRELRVFRVRSLLLPSYQAIPCEARPALARRLSLASTHRPRPGAPIG